MEEKYYYLKNDIWNGPISLERLSKTSLKKNTLIWYPELCPKNTEKPEDCTHEKSKYKDVINEIKPKKIFKRFIVFTKSKLKGFFRYKNEFQIFPATYENIPKNRYATHFPVVLEFWIDSSENAVIPDAYKEIGELLDMSESTNALNKCNQICHLLSAITNHRFFLYNHHDGSWFLELPDDELDRDNVKNIVWGFGVFTYSGIKEDLSADGFSHIKDFQEVKPAKHYDYFLNDPVDSKDQEIMFSQHMYVILDGFYSLDKKMKKATISSIYLICNGMDLQGKMKSISFLSLISSIETIINIEYKDKLKAIEFECHDCKTIKNAPYKCHKCDRPIWGIAAKFREFLAEFVHNTEGSIKKYKKIYGIRSKLVHSGSLLLGDNYIDWNQIESPNSHWEIHLETLQLAKLALTNWLLAIRNRNIEKAENKG